MINNSDIARYLKEIKESVDADKHGGAMFFARTKMIELGFFDDMPESSFDPFRPCPIDWKAFQLSIFDNGEIPKPKRKRSYIERSKMRYAGAIKIWTREEINFRMKNQIAWKANVYLWDTTIVKQVCKELLEQKYIDQATVDLMDSMIAGCESNSGEWFYSIPVLKSKEAGSRWMKGHVMAVRREDGVFTDTVFAAPECAISGRGFSEQMADGKDLDDKVVGQMRLGSHAGLDAWSTQPAV